jgi:putative peptidoglycan lipid II flippase
MPSVELTTEVAAATKEAPIPRKAPRLVDPTTGITVTHPHAAITPVPVSEDDEEQEAPVWKIGGIRFRFSLANLRPGGDFSMRRFSIVEGAILLMLGILASKGLGVLRQSLFNALFGTGVEASAYYAAYRLPDTLFNLVAGGALTQAFVPVFVAYQRRHEQYEAWYLASLVFNVLLVALTALVLVGTFLAPAFVADVLVPGYPAPVQALTTSLTRIMLIQPLLLGLSTIVTAVLSSRERFFLPAVATAVYNLGLIAGLLVALVIPGVGIYGPTVGVLLAAALQIAVQLPALRRLGVRYFFAWNLRYPGLREVMVLFVPSMLAVGVAYISSIVETTFTSFLPDLASLAALHNAYMIFYLPVSLIAQAIGQAALPRMARLEVEHRYGPLRRLFTQLILVSVLLSLFSALVLGLLGLPIIDIIFRHGAFDEHSALLTNMALLGYLVGLPGVSVGDVVARSFYALKDARTPLLTNIFALLARIVLIVWLFVVLVGEQKLLAISLSLAGAATAEALLLCLILFLRLHRRERRAEGAV